MGKPGADGDLWFWNSGSVVQSWERRWRSRWYHHERLEEADMEHIMEASTIRQLETISDAPNALEHAEGPCPTWPQLVFGAGVQRLRRAME